MCEAGTVLWDSLRAWALGQELPPHQLCTWAHIFLSLALVPFV